MANLLVGISYGWWKSKHTRHHANPNKDGADPDIALSAVAFTPERANRHRSPLLRWLVARQGWYFFPLLLLEGASLHWDGIRRVFSAAKVERRWFEMSFLAVRIGGLVTVAFLVLSPGKALAFLAIELAVFGFYMGFSFAPNHIGMPLVSPRLKLDFLRRQVLMSRNIRGGTWMSIFMGGLNYQAPPPGWRSRSLRWRRPRRPIWPNTWPARRLAIWCSPRPKRARAAEQRPLDRIRIAAAGGR